MNSEKHKNGSLDNCLWSLIQPHLAVGENVLWMGRPVCRKLWSMILGEMVFGLILISVGLPGCVLVWKTAKGNDGSAFFFVIGLLFVSMGISLLAAPWRIRRLLRNTAYAVTSQRVLIVNGVIWGLQATVRSRGLGLESYDSAQAMQFKKRGRRRDIQMGGQWLSMRKGRKIWVHSGFLAPDDPSAAEQAIQLLTSGANETQHSSVAE
jgi:hypothetical protein